MNEDEVTHILKRLEGRAWMSITNFESIKHKIYFFCLFRAASWHMEVPRAEVESEL